MFETIKEKERALLVYVYTDKEEENVLDELELLAASGDYEPVGRITQKRDRPDKSYFVGPG
ncbi:MAG: GTPase HflX, partial [Clostridia bacterium]|nr:GTPase HflX [Clostridia bacterium]